MTTWTNFHTHSNYCDGKEDIQHYVLKAIELRMASLGFSSHAPLPFDCKWCMKQENLTNYLNTIDKLKSPFSTLEIYKSLEIDFIPGLITPHDYASQLDYTIGSIHFVDQMKDGRHWEIDGLHTFFLEGLENIFNNKIKDAITRYFELTRQMISTSRPTIVGHLDKIKIQNISNKFYNEQDTWYKDEIKKTIEVIKQYECIVEVNTRGLYQKKAHSTYPSPWILELINKKNIPITFNSDAHHPDDLINHFKEAANMLTALHIKKITTLREGSWRSYSFDESGIKFY